LGRHLGKRKEYGEEKGGGTLFLRKGIWASFKKRAFPQNILGGLIWGVGIKEFLPKFGIYGFGL